MKNTTNACHFYANWSRLSMHSGSPWFPSSCDRQEEEVPAAQPEAEPSFLTALTMPFAAFAGFGILEVARILRSDTISTITPTHTGGPMPVNAAYCLGRVAWAHGQNETSAHDFQGEEAHAKPPPKPPAPKKAPQPPKPVKPTPKESAKAKAARNAKEDI